MTAKVEHWPTTGLCFLQEPGARVVRARVKPFEGIDLCDYNLADFPRCQNLFEAQNQWIKVPVISNTKFDSTTGARGDHAITFASVERHGLFAKNMFAGRSGGECLARVQMHRRRDVNGINLLVGDQLFPVSIPLSRAEFSRKRLGLVEASATYRKQIAVQQVAQRRCNSLASDVAATD